MSYRCRFSFSTWTHNSSILVVCYFGTDKENSEYNSKRSPFKNQANKVNKRVHCPLLQHRAKSDFVRRPIL